MAGPNPEGERPPLDGRLPAGWAEARRTEPLALYLHLPWCRRRCGYCDFNTYVLERADSSATRPYLASLAAEIDLAAAVLGSRRVTTVYFGGGTPTLLAATAFAELLDRIKCQFELDETAEITTEANPETLSPAYLDDLRAAGLNRLSLGLQSVVPHVLKTLDRAHPPDRALAAVAWARQVGFDSVSLDLIYGTPGESLADWEASLDAVVASGVDHVSAYALIVEPGTRLAARIARGELTEVDDDDLADKYLVADERLAAAGLGWYEVSNWASPDQACRHNLAYWRSADWWGFGAGAHSHIAGIRWWNYRLPRSYRSRLQAGQSPAEGREYLSAEQRRQERVLLELRLRRGLDPAVLTPSERARLAQLRATGLLELAPGHLRLTTQGRLLADRVVRDLLD